MALQFIYLIQKLGGASMGYLTKLNNFKRVIGFSTFFSVISCLVPEAVLATPYLSYTFVANQGESTFTFVLNTSVKDSQPSSERGFYPRSVIKAQYVCAEEINDLCSGTIKFKPGSIKASRISESDINRQGNESLDSSWIGGTKYHVNLQEIGTSTKLQFIVYSKYKDEIGDLPSSGFNGLISMAVNDEDFTPASQGLIVNAVPESTPEDTASNLLGVGAIGTVLFLKRTNASKKLAETKSNSLE
ncbi:hypothetical protein QUB80_33080 [Chlorogloeopsis sp. ULAP01]|uniref:hypothetical protein n=1 Tax=Chlorogloeopsis sp. ULAP01 TaxID=3056483 RepID=UPI0025AB3B6F|nr:hypothetical protein [Chlorogloeopsis sp. ULAP01]MDM9385490.1 hypothetical protein [Chlorogloeopsis sp. ULAP01]